MVNPHLHAHLLSCVSVEFRDITKDCHMTQYDLDLWHIDLSNQSDMSNSEEQLGILSDAALSILLSNPFGSF